MTSVNSETGHYKNVANFKGLIHFCESLKSAYQPSRADMTIEKLNEYYNTATAVMDQVATAEIQLSQAVQNRQSLFEDTKKLAVKASVTLQVVNPLSVAIKTAKHYIAKIRGKRLGTVASASDANETTEAPKARSAAQTSFDAIITHFDKLIAVIATEPGYAPNETEITVIGLQARLSLLKDVNDDAVRAAAKLKLLISQRDQILYKPDSGLTALARSVKQYIKVLYGAKSNELKAANVYSFRKR
ncbi:hypothetical protein [Taibaiella soli]|uniref:Uncharacterized protein n=1 Tax=Taibaiella soli TaxID=1649169 RepID=A0A2W2B401_9BACT|nr:hypothetical protein [Taibaiella soli]PZF70969.1 hypothetical protein DN068_19860 [Taibaiella soli]